MLPLHSMVLAETQLALQTTKISPSISPIIGLLQKLHNIVIEKLMYILPSQEANLDLRG